MSFGNRPAIVQETDYGRKRTEIARRREVDAKKSVGPNKFEQLKLPFNLQRGRYVSNLQLRKRRCPLQLRRADREPSVQLKTPHEILDY